MDIHKPKPWHGLREFLKEYVIIVVGVLTALGAEAIVERLHWRHETGVAKDAIAFDLRRLVGEAAAKDASSPCVAKVFGGYAQALEEAQATKRLRAISWNGAPPTVGWGFRSWYALNSGQTLAHLSNHDQLILAAMAGYLEYARTLRTVQIENVGALITIAGPPRAVSEAEIASLKSALGRAAQNESAQRNLGQQLETMVLRSGLVTEAEAKAAYVEGIQRGRNAPICHVSKTPVLRLSDAARAGLSDPPKALGEARVSGIGVNDALTTER